MFEEDLRVIRLIQNLVGDAGRPARRRSQPTHSWHSGDTLLTMRVTFFAAKRTVGGQTWHPASDGNVSVSAGRGLQVLKDLCHGLLQLRRRQFSGTLDGEDLVTTIRFADAPRTIGDQIQFGQPRSRVPKHVAIEAGHGLLDPIEPPAGQPLLVGGEGEKQVQSQVLWLKSWKDAFAAEAMVDPRERRRDGAHSLRHQQRQGLFQWHGMISVRGNARREGVATPRVCSA